LTQELEPISGITGKKIEAQSPKELSGRATSTKLSFLSLEMCKHAERLLVEGTAE
jgi:hypothetical protein